MGDRVASIVAFLRAGYPSGMPAVGYAPLLALLPRRLSDDEIRSVISKLVPGRPPDDNVPVGNVPVGNVPVGNVPVGNVPVDNVPVDKVPVDNVDVDNVDVGVEITRVTNEMPLPDDIERVQRGLTAI